MEISGSYDIDRIEDDAIDVIERSNIDTRFKVDLFHRMNCASGDLDERAKDVEWNILRFIYYIAISYSRSGDVDRSILYDLRDIVSDMETKYRVESDILLYMIWDV